MATTVFSVTAAMVKLVPVKTVRSDADIEALAQRKEYWITACTGYTSAPSDAETLSNLRRMVELETAMALMDEEPHSIQDGSLRMEHYPAGRWMGELKQLHDKYDTRTDPVFYEQPVDTE